MDALNLTGAEIAALVAITFTAGVVRGFTGFALSAVAMAMAVMILPPVQIIPMLWFLEATASVMMVRGGWAEARRGLSLGLVAGSALGLPLGLMLTLSMPAELSRIVALCLICGLAVAQLMRVKLAFLATRPGLGVAGLTAGAATGLAGVGGMVVALYVLALDLPARVIRASLVLYLAVSLCISFFTYLIVGTMDQTAVLRGLVFVVPTVAGVALGKALFVPEREKYYKRICLGLLIFLALAGIARTLLA